MYKRDLFTGQPKTIDVVSDAILLPRSITMVIDVKQRNMPEKDWDVLISTYWEEEARVFTYAGLLSTLARANEDFERFLMYVAERSQVINGFYTLPKLYRGLERVLLVPHGDYFSLRRIID